MKIIIKRKRLNERTEEPDMKQAVCDIAIHAFRGPSMQYYNEVKRIFTKYGVELSRFVRDRGVLEQELYTLSDEDIKALYKYLTNIKINRFGKVTQGK